VISVGGAVNFGRSRGKIYGILNKRQKHTLLASSYRLTLQNILAVNNIAKQQTVFSIVQHLKQRNVQLSVYIIVSKNDDLVSVITRNFKLVTVSNINAIQFFDLFRSSLILIDHTSLAYIAARYIT
jgi:hypothetical protein